MLQIAFCETAVLPCGAIGLHVYCCVSRASLLLSTGYGSGKTVSIRVDNYGTTSVSYKLTHEGALAELYSTDVPSQVRAHQLIVRLATAPYHDLLSRTSIGAAAVVPGACMPCLLLACFLWALRSRMSA